MNLKMEQQYQEARIFILTDTADQILKTQFCK
jgi:hypothetical protein